MQLTSENYYSKEANDEYMSASLFKELSGTYGRTKCEAEAMAKLKGEYSEEDSKALLIGSYVDSYFEGKESFDKFKAEHSGQIYTKTSLKKADPSQWELLADYKNAEEIIKKIKSSEVLMSALSGEKQVIMTGEIGGIPWKIKMDSYAAGEFITDLKVIKSFSESTWVRDLGYLNFAHYWGYDIQAAVYQEIVRQNTGVVLPFYLAVATKEDGIDIGLFEVDPPYIKEALQNVRSNLDDVIKVWRGDREPVRCNKCRYCRMTKVLTGPSWLSSLDEQ